MTWHGILRKLWAWSSYWGEICASFRAHMSSCWWRHNEEGFCHDLNPIQNLWRILKQKIYGGGGHFTSKQKLWAATLTSCKEIRAETLQTLPNSVDGRIEVKLLWTNGSYVKITWPVTMFLIEIFIIFICLQKNMI